MIILMLIIIITNFQQDKSIFAPSATSTVKKIDNKQIISVNPSEPCHPCVNYIPKSTRPKR